MTLFGHPLTYKQEDVQQVVYNKRVVLLDLLCRHQFFLFLCFGVLKEAQMN